GALGLHGAALHFRQASYQRQTQSQAASRSLQRLVSLSKNVKDARHQLRRYAVPVVPDRDGDLVVRLVALGREPDVASGARELGRVIEEIGEALGQPLRIGLQRYWFRRHFHYQILAPGRDQGAAALNGRGHDPLQHDALLPDLDLPLDDAGNIEQIVHNP